MSLAKAIEHRKERRKPYYDSGRLDRTCRPHGGCPWCYRDRMYKQQRANEEMLQIMQEWRRTPAGGRG
jgi:hypothetical protein